MRVPSGTNSQCRFLADIQTWQATVTPGRTLKVVINSTGSVVMNREVTLDSLRSSAGNLSVTVNRQANVSQPDTPVWWWTDCRYSTNADRFTPERRFAAKRTFQRQPSITWCARHRAGRYAMDLMSILQSMQSAGCLRQKPGNHL
ncbi:flagellar basal body P-ring protein FlgI [Shigella sonnei]